MCENKITVKSGQIVKLSSIAIMNICKNVFKTQTPLELMCVSLFKKLCASVKQLHHRTMLLSLHFQMQRTQLHHKTRNSGHGTFQPVSNVHKNQVLSRNHEIQCSCLHRLSLELDPPKPTPTLWLKTKGRSATVAFSASV